ncbi:MAG: BofC C-terminal domain-containing protein [Syntrophomonadaceae bacterium]
MKKPTMGLWLVLVLFLTFGIGYSFAHIYQNLNVEIKQKPVLGIEDTEKELFIVKEDTPIVYECYYKRCEHKIIAEFDDKPSIVGKDWAEIQKLYAEANGYQVYWQDNILVIKENIDDWCPDDKKRCRLKEYQGMVAIFRGPDAQNDMLDKITQIQVKNLPDYIQKDIREGKFEFANEQELNDVMETLDEYL